MRVSSELKWIFTRIIIKKKSTSKIEHSDLSLSFESIFFVKKKRKTMIVFSTKRMIRIPWSFTHLLQWRPPPPPRLNLMPTTISQKKWYRFPSSLSRNSCLLINRFCSLIVAKIVYYDVLELMLVYFPSFKCACSSSILMISL